MISASRSILFVALLAAGCTDSTPAPPTVPEPAAESRPHVAQPSGTDDEAAEPQKDSAPKKNDDDLPEGVPAKVKPVLKEIDTTGRAPEGYEGGRTFENREDRLPRKDKDRKRIRYREWDVNPKKPGVNRGPERLVTGSDGSAYYSPDHYKSFIKIR
jgi:guanyl-specific ribonuclease Sa